MFNRYWNLEHGMCLVSTPPRACIGPVIIQVVRMKSKWHYSWGLMCLRMRWPLIVLWKISMAREWRLKTNTSIIAMVTLVWSGLLYWGCRLPCWYLRTTTVMARILGYSLQETFFASGIIMLDNWCIEHLKLCHIPSRLLRKQRKGFHRQLVRVIAYPRRPNLWLIRYYAG